MRPDFTIFAIVPSYFTLMEASSAIKRNISKIQLALFSIKQKISNKYKCYKNDSYITYAGKRYILDIKVIQEESEDIFVYNGKCYIKLKCYGQKYLKAKFNNWIKEKMLHHCYIKLCEAFYLVRFFRVIDIRFINIIAKNYGLHTVIYTSSTFSIVVNPRLMYLPLHFLEYFICYAFLVNVFDDHSSEFFLNLFESLPSKNIFKYSIAR